MAAISPTATGPRPIGPPLAEMQFSPRIAGASICCLAVEPTISGRASGQRRQAVRWRTATKYIATHSPESLEWGPFEGLGPDIVEGIRRIKSQDGPDLILWGSSTLTSTLLEHELADEVLLVVYPVLLGTGKRFFAEGTPPRSFELVSTKAMPSGIILSFYKVAGPLKTG
jgi:riboflavin biosynthesis pyrimidine reductase